MLGAACNTRFSLDTRRVSNEKRPQLSLDSDVQCNPLDYRSLTRMAVHNLYDFRGIWFHVDNCVMFLLIWCYRCIEFGVRQVVNPE